MTRKPFESAIVALALIYLVSYFLGRGLGTGALAFLLKRTLLNTAALCTSAVLLTSLWYQLKQAMKWRW